MKRRWVALLLVLAMTGAACSVQITTSTTVYGVDNAPELVKGTFVAVTRRAAALAGYDTTRSELLDFARAVCEARISSPEELSEFVDDWAGPNADAMVAQMWFTAGDAATASFCPIN